MSEAGCRPIFIFDLDETLFHTDKDNIDLTTPRPFLLQCLKCLSRKFELFVFTLGTHDYAIKKCNQFGITDYIPVGRIYAREESTHLNKILTTVLYDCCPSCKSRVVVVDDSPEVWQTTDDVPAKVVEWKRITNISRKIASQSVIRIPRFYGDEKDTALLYLTVFMLSCHIIPVQL